MSQATNINVATSSTAGRTEPANFTAEINGALNAFLSSHSGASAPSYKLAGTVWLDTDTNCLFMYDGTNWIPIPQGGVRSELTIATGAITPTLAGTIVVDTESDAASDDLDTITATNMNDGDIIILKAADSARTVVVKNGTGNIACGADFSLDNVLDRIMLQWDNGASSWVAIGTPISSGA